MDTCTKNKRSSIIKCLHCCVTPNVFSLHSYSGAAPGLNLCLEFQVRRVWDSARNQRSDHDGQRLLYSVNNRNAAIQSVSPKRTRWLWHGHRAIHTGRKSSSEKISRSVYISYETCYYNNNIIRRARSRTMFLVQENSSVTQNLCVCAATSRQNYYYNMSWILITSLWYWLWM